MHCQITDGNDDAALADLVQQKRETSVTEQQNQPVTIVKKNVKGWVMRKQLVALFGVGVGAAVMYLFDPDRGSRRRALLRDKLATAANKVPDAMSATARDLRNRAKGLAAAARSKVSSSEPATDQVVEARVRSKLGRVVSHPHAIHVTTHRGQVTLSGPILAPEVPELMSRIKAVDGVKDVVNQLEEHEQSGNIPALQGA